MQLFHNKCYTLGTKEDSDIWFDNNGLNLQFKGGSGLSALRRPLRRDPLLLDPVSDPVRGREIPPGDDELPLQHFNCGRASWSLQPGQLCGLVYEGGAAPGGARGRSGQAEEEGGGARAWIYACVIVLFVKSL